MKRSGMEHPKLRRLMRELGCGRAVAVGVLESLWHLTAKAARRGDIGRWTDDDIADWIDLPGTAPGDLMAALVSSGFLDRCECHRLVVHGWREHADDATKKAVGRAGEDFVEKCPDMSRQSRDILRLPEPEPEPKPEPVIASTHFPVSRSRKSSKPRYGDDFLALWDAYPPRNGRRDGKLPAWKEWERLGQEDREAACAAVESYRRHCVDTQTRPCDLVRYLRHRRWEDEWATSPEEDKTWMRQFEA